MKLYICEKPSLAEALANALGNAEKKDGFYQVNGDKVAWLHGHIMQLNDAEDYDINYKSWSYDPLPIIPLHWGKKIPSKNIGIINTIKTLYSQADEIINVGDPDREGQLLVDEVLEYINNTLPTKRLFINAMDNTTIERALSQIEDNNSAKNRNMYAAALGREYIDWMIGINATRKYTLDAGKLIPVGRVKVPVIAMVYRRNKAIENFKSIKHYGLTAYFRCNTSLPFQSDWKPKEELLDSEGRITDVITIREIEQKISGKSGKVTKCETKQKTEYAPLPYSLSTLQRSAGPVLGMNPAETLETAQKLYEKKLTTYPRSDCNYIPDEQYNEAITIIDNLKLTGNDKLLEWAQGSTATLHSKAFNTSKTEAHHAIIPTTQRVDLNTLNDKEKALYIMIAKRYLLQFYPAHIYDETLVEIDCEGEKFIAKGKIIKDNGWKSIEKEDEKETPKLPTLSENTELIMSSESVQEKNTTPPAHFTQDTLIGAMTAAYKYLKDKSLKDTLKSVKGIGTEATRSTTLTELIRTGMLYEVTDKKKKELYVSETAKELIECLPDELTYPDKTALLEIKLDKIAKGELSLDTLLAQESEFTKNLMQLPSKFTKTKPEQPSCPLCGKGILYLHSGQYGKFWSCSEYKNGCNITFEDNNGNPMIIECPTCKKGYLRRQKTKNGDFFWSCSEYKNSGCNASFPDVHGKPVIIKCPTCKKGYLKRQKTKNGDFFWSCSEYKNSGCNASFSDNKEQPVIKLCPKCQKAYLKKWHGKKGDYYQCPSCKEFYDVTKTGLPVIKKITKK